jgi:hypothetical protein
MARCADCGVPRLGVAPRRSGQAIVMPSDRDSWVRERLVSRTCGWCGAPVVYRGTGRPPRYCSKSCRNRASEVRTAERRLERDIVAGRIPGDGTPVREVVERVVRVPEQHRPPPAPVSATAWTRLLTELARQLEAGEQVAVEHSNHKRLLRSLREALAALDAATPGGLRALDRRR